LLDYGGCRGGEESNKAIVHNTTGAEASTGYNTVGNSAEVGQVGAGNVAGVGQTNNGGVQTGAADADATGVVVVNTQLTWGPHF
jgi:hypothetical protein